MNLSIFNSIIIILFLVVAILVLFRRAKLPPIFGYLFVGSLVGPHAFGWIRDVKNISQLADFGVMFLMFTVGLEFSYTRLRKMKSQVLSLGSIQVILTTAITTIIAMWLGMTFQEAIIVGAIVSMSSTAIVLKQLIDQLELDTLHGNHSVAILLFQDLAAIPFFILIYSLAIPDQPILILLWSVIAKSFVAILAILVIGRWIMRPLFREVVGSHSLELFTLTALLITLSTAWITQQMGLSLALGAFLAGMILAETELRHQLEAVIRPFRDILMGLFFISIGMLFNVREIPITWSWAFLLLVALLIFKTALIFLLSLMAGRNAKEALRTGLVLAQGGEFGFALLALALTYHLLPSLYGQVVLGALLFSMALAPFILKYNEKIAEIVLRKISLEKIDKSKAKPVQVLVDQEKHVILCGYGRVGQGLARILENENIPYLAIDFDLNLVQKAKSLGYPVIYGDASLYEILQTCRIQNAHALVITFEQISANLKILQQVRMHHKTIPIFVRALDDSELEKLQDYGATEVIPASLEICLTLASHLLATLQVPVQHIWQEINQIRKNRYQLLHEIISGSESTVAEVGDFQKRFITLPENAYAIGLTIKELAFDKKGILLASINHEGIEDFHFSSATRLQVGDTLRLYGLQVNLEEVEQYLIEGNVF
ncbi:MAG: cation:proton antiporter [Gammaproteobacteria bacterium]|nr:cation:proton antiporter [Gammaproteobacteria bacterium]